MMRFRKQAALWLAAAVLAACDGGGPTAPEPPPTLPRGIANALAFDNLPLIRSLQDRELPGTLLISIRAPGMQRNGRIAPGSAWGYSFMDLSTGFDQRYSWEVFSNGEIFSFGRSSPVGPASAVEIEPLIAIDSDQAAMLAEEHGGRTYFEQHPGGSIRIRYFHFASRVLCELQYEDFSPGSDRCEIVIVLNAGTGEFLGREIGLECTGF